MRLVRQAGQFLAPSIRVTQQLIGRENRSSVLRQTGSQDLPDGPACLLARVSS
jgi:hypothetical protein